MMGHFFPFAGALTRTDIHRSELIACRDGASPHTRANEKERERFKSNDVSSLLRFCLCNDSQKSRLAKCLIICHVISSRKDRKNYDAIPFNSSVFRRY